MTRNHGKNTPLVGGVKLEVLFEGPVGRFECGQCLELDPRSIQPIFSITQLDQLLNLQGNNSQYSLKLQFNNSL
ncbi:hypothetical protein DPMN_132144 [Dreissena polymorpha]|uniref:Uncharacterized protein n=1 Tax=Dreissena polymorpha TaxID=45954 RepID=A0A9D4FR13_DREPO|nr:hypothetical protein DPMN_132144 [Dreissena polymorpha]